MLLKNKKKNKKKTPQKTRTQDYEPSTKTAYKDKIW